LIYFYFFSITFINILYYNYNMATQQNLITTGTSDAVTFGGFRDSNATVTFTATGVSGSVVVALEGTIDGTNWVNTDEDGNLTITADGTYAYEKLEVAYKELRFNWVSGTATSILVNYAFNS
jgi:hypothetical protein